MLHIADVFHNMYPSEKISVHTNREREYSHFANEELAVEVHNPENEEKNLFLFRHKKHFTLVFAGWSCHYPLDEEGSEHMMAVAGTILSDVSSVLHIEWQESILECLVYKNRLLFSESAKKEFGRFLDDAAFLEAIAQKQAIMKEIYWK